MSKCVPSGSKNAIVESVHSEILVTIIPLFHCAKGPFHSGVLITYWILQALCRSMRKMTGETPEVHSDKRRTAATAAATAAAVATGSSGPSGS